MSRESLGAGFLETPAGREDAAHKRGMVDRRYQGEQRVFRAERCDQLKADNTDRAEERIIPPDAEPAPQPPRVYRTENENYPHHKGGRFHKLRHFPPFQYEVGIILPHTGELLQVLPQNRAKSTTFAVVVSGQWS